MVQIICSSFSRASGTDSDFRLNTQSVQGMSTGASRRGFSRVRAISYHGLWTVYNVRAGQNDTLRIQEANAQGPIVVATVPEGNYTSLTMPAVLAAALTARSAATGNSYTYAVSYDDTLGKYRITATGGVFAVLPPTANRLAGLNRLLGMSLSSPSASYASSQTGPRCASHSAYPMVFVHCSIVSATATWNALYAPNEGDQVGTQSDVLMAIPSQSFLFGQAISLYEPSKTWLSVADGNLSSLSFQLRDEAGNLVDTHGTPWSVQLELE